MVTKLAAIPGRNANVPRDEEFDETAVMVTEQIQQVAPSVFPDNPTREVEESFNVPTGNSQGVHSHITSTSGARNLEGNNGVHNGCNPGSVRSMVSHATIRPVLLLVLAASVVLFGTGLQQGSSIAMAIVLVVSIMTVLELASTSLGERVSELMTNLMRRMLSLSDDPQKRTFELMKVLGFKESEMKPFASALGIETIAGLTGIGKEEWFESANNTKLGDFRSKRLWLGLCAFRPYYDTFGEQKALDGKRVQYCIPTNLAFQSTMARVIIKL